MRIENFKSEVRDGKSRVAASVVWEDSDRPTLDVFYETAVESAWGLCCNPHAFLIAAFLPAWRHKERRIRVEAEVCPELRRGLETVLELIRYWYHRDRPLLTIEAVGPLPRPDRAPASRTGFFFSGGIDSLATLRMNHLAFPQSHPGRIQDGFLVFGLEVDLPESFNHAVAALGQIARDAGIELLPISTNVRYLDDDWVFWGHEFQAAALASIAHAFADRLTVVSIASTDDIPNLTPNGSHPMLDPLYTSFDLRIRHDDVAMSRLAKTQVVADWDVALQNLRVCNDSTRYRPDALNCGECEKCVRTMLGLEAIGALERTRGFQRPLTVELVRQRVFMDGLTFHYYTQLLTPLRDRGRGDLADAVELIYRSMHGEIGWKAPIRRFDRRYFGGHLVAGIKRACFGPAGEV